MKDESREPTGVRETAKQVAEIRRRWAWVEPSVWTDRMLAALENGVKGGVWYSLMDKVESISNLRASFRRVRQNGGAAGVDRVTIEMFEQRLEENLTKLQRDLQEGRYRPAAIRRTWIPKPGKQEKRPLGIPTVRDRVVQTALRNVLEPIFEKRFAKQSFGFRPESGCRAALERVVELLEGGYRFVVDVDLRQYFDSIPHAPLMGRIHQDVADGRVLGLLESFLDQEIFEGLDRWTPTSGTPQGAVISPLLSNIYLNPLDHLMAEQGFEMIRYADDFVVLCRSREAAEEALGVIRRWVEDAGLALHPVKTKIVMSPEEAFEFLGYRFVRGHRFPRPSSCKKLRESVRAKTRRCNGTSIPTIVEAVNPTLKGWYEYFAYATTSNVFEALDKWTRMRFRSILRFRRGREGRGRGTDHHRWPNVYFRDIGLFCLVDAHAALRQSSLR